MPKGRIRPSDLGIYARFAGRARYPALTSVTPSGTGIRSCTSLRRVILLVGLLLLLVDLLLTLQDILHELLRVGR